MVKMWHRGKFKGWQCVGKCKQFEAVTARSRAKLSRTASNFKGKGYGLYET